MRKDRKRPGTAVPMFFAVVTAVVTFAAWSLTSTRQAGGNVALTEHRPLLDGIVDWMALHLGAGGVLLIGLALLALCLVPLFRRRA